MDKRANDEPGSGGRTQRTAATQAQERSLMRQEFIVDATTAATLTMKTRHTYGWLRRTLSVQSSSLRVVPTLVVVRCTMIGTARGT